MVDMKDFVEEFRTDIRRYWRSNVKKYFNKRQEEYGLPPKLNHRFMFAKTEDSSPVLRNALVVNWTPMTNHITVSTAPIMVKTVSFGKRVNARKYKYATGERVAAGTKMYDLIELLGYKHKDKSGRYVVSIDARVKPGTRKSPDPQIWANWFSEFTAFVDFKLNEYADRIANKVADELVEF